MNIPKLGDIIVYANHVTFFLAFIASVYNYIGVV